MYIREEINLQEIKDISKKLPKNVWAQK
ncbi:hypothetical protein ACTIGL_28030 (plasmid) [Bacillus shihchuchen]